MKALLKSQELCDLVENRHPDLDEGHANPL